MKKFYIAVCILLLALSITACSQKPDSSAGQPQDRVQTSEPAGQKLTADELFDLFIDGSINAVDPTDPTSVLSINDLNRDPEDWYSYSIGDRVDLDNDGENELILCGPYGGIYLDARNGQVYQFAAGEGSASVLSYVWYNGAVWILYSNRMNGGYEVYHMERFEGADNLTAEMTFGEEPVDPADPESGRKYTLNGAEISYEEYTAMCSKIFASEVSTN